MDSEIEFDEVIHMTRSLANLLMSSTSGMSHEEVSGIGHLVDHLAERLHKIKDAKGKENVIYMSGPDRRGNK
jgi:hypothetical protein